ncbi:MAG TPA: PQQ-binding-like beta-propeller repeat protein [Pyrinomonadaceae bacterium]
MTYCSPRLIRTLSFILLLAVVPAFSGQQATSLPQLTPRALIQWKGRPGVKRYRLQLARDAKFTDIIFDRAVEGTEYLVRELPEGRYYWRVAAATPETGRYSRPAPLIVAVPTTETPTPTPVLAPTPRPTPRQRPTPRPTPLATPRPTPLPTPVAPKLLTPGDTGWRTATGEVSQPRVAALRTTSSLDLVGVNSDGMVYALDGSNGVALWTARFKQDAKRGEPTGNGGAPTFTPLIIDGASGLSNVVAAFNGGVHALDGATGRKLWRTSLQGRPTSGMAADLDGDGKQEIIIAEADSANLAILNGTGKFIAEVKLDAAVIGAPVLITARDQRAIMLVLENGLVEMRNINGERLHAVKLDTKPTTPLLVVQGGQGTIGLLGVDGNLIALDLNDPNLKPIGRIATEDDAPRGLLSSIDLDNDGKLEVVMITRLGRTVVVNAVDGKIRWYAGGATDAESAAFADVNADGMLDVLVAAGPSFAVAFSGRDGSMIWKAEDGGSGALQKNASMRSLVTAIADGGKSIFLVGTDAARTGLRAVGLPQGSVKVATR